MGQSKPIQTTQAPQIRAHDVYGMALKLIARHGPAAAEIADFTMVEHELLGDAARCEAWRAVGSTVSDMLSRRLPTSGITIQ